MKINPVKRKLARGQTTFGCWVNIGHSLIPEILAPAGFDWLCVDMEHSNIDLGNLLPMIVAIEANGMVPIVRVGELNANLIKRVMDIGAYGVMVANVCSAKEAQEAVNAVKYPPLGTRGVGLFRAQKFGVGFEDYKKWLAKESVVVIQIEHIDAVRDIDAIFSVKGIDAYLIGPYDLSGSMGKPGKFFDKDVEDAVKTVIAAGRRHKIPSGFHSVSSDAGQALKRYKQGFQLIGFCVDSIFLCDAARNGLQKLKRMVR